MDPERAREIKAAWKLANKPKPSWGFEVICSGCAIPIDIEGPVLRLAKCKYCGAGCPFIVARNKAKGKIK